MTTATSPEMNTDIQALVNSGIRLAESQWRAWSDYTNVGTLYQMAFDAWKHSTDLQMSFWDACWKMGCLSFDISVPGAGHSEATTTEPTKPRLKKVASN